MFHLLTIFLNNWIIKLEENWGNYWEVTYYKSRDGILHSDLQYMFTNKVQIYSV